MWLEHFFVVLKMKATIQTFLVAWSEYIICFTTPVWSIFYLILNIVVHAMSLEKSSNKKFIFEVFEIMTV